VAQPLRSSPQPSRSSDRRLAIARSLQSRQSEVEVAQPNELPDSAELSDDLLDESSLNTVLDMLSAMETAEELEILESLTEAQKRQIWDATPKALKIQLWHLRQAAATAPSKPAELTPTSPIEVDLHDSTQLIASSAEAASSNPAVTDSTIEVGDRVVLKAEPDRSVAELKAIFEVTHIQDQTVKVRAETLGTQEYPLDWLLIYAKHSRKA
jgi:hypothetical protein